MSETSVLVLGGGPDAEREVSLRSAAGVAEGLRATGRFEVSEQTIDRLTADELRAMEGEVVFPVLHGGWGEGGPLQDLLEADGRAYVGCRPRAARLAMDKLATKLAAERLGLATPDAAALNPRDEGCPVELPAVVKPAHEGSSVGLHICRSGSDWTAAIGAVREDTGENPGRVYLIERMVAGRELTVGLLDGEALPVIEICPAEGVYDYEAKYGRKDTRYVANPELPRGVEETVRAGAVALAGAMGVRHVGRVDFLLDESGRAWVLEVNTMPGFTASSLLPMGAKAAGLSMSELCGRLVELAVRDGRGSGVVAGR